MATSTSKILNRLQRQINQLDKIETLRRGKLSKNAKNKLLKSFVSKDFRDLLDMPAKAVA